MADLIERIPGGYTRGPWIADLSQVVATEVGETVCVVADWSPTVVAADAALIALAPEMAAEIARLTAELAATRRTVASLYIERDTAQTALAELDAMLAVKQADEDFIGKLDAMLVETRVALEALEALAEGDPIEGVEDYADAEKATLIIGRCTIHCLTLGDFRRARTALATIRNAKGKEKL
jgi:hypothetical protein